MTNCIPSRVVNVRKSIPWLNTDCIRIIRKRDHFYRLTKSTNSETICGKYRHFRNMAVTTVPKAKHSFLRSMSSLIRTPKDFWSVYHSLTPNRERIPHTLTHSTVTAESLMSMARTSQVVSPLHLLIPPCPLLPPPRAPTLNCHSFNAQKR